MLSRRLAEMNLDRPVVLALPRGGVPVAVAIASRLDAPVDLLLVRKVGVPAQPELAAGAVVDGAEPAFIVNEEIVRALGLTPADLEPAAAKQLAEIERRRSIYFRDREPVAVTGRTAIVVDDGIATGATVKAGLDALRRRGPKRIVLAVPVAPRDTLDELRRVVDDVVCLQMPEPFIAIGYHYLDFRQLTDTDVTALLDRFEDAGNGPETGH